MDTGNIFVVIAIAGLGGILGWNLKSIQLGAEVKIQECQKSLPRNEFCHIIAVPKSKREAAK